MQPKNNGKRNRTRGHNFERQIALEFRELGWKTACTTRYASRMRDDQKVDIFQTNPLQKLNNMESSQTSNCCNGELLTSSGEEGTSCYICSKCQKPCDVKNV